MLRVFDGKIETEEEDSETEHIFEMGGNVSGKGAGKAALDLVAKGALAVVDAGSLYEQCIQGNVTANYASALIKDVQPSIAVLKDAMNALQSQIGKVNDETLAGLNENADKALKAYEEAVGTIHRTIAIYKPKTKTSKKDAKPAV
ncbi:unnamed protein product [Symbiodinium microadriaticum]|nr:unnamed protein product [Symbiodinium microadriaticum]